MLGSWEAGKHHPKSEGGSLAPQGAWGVLQMLECAARAAPSCGCVVGVGQVDHRDMLERLGELLSFVLEKIVRQAGGRARPPSLLRGPRTTKTLNPSILAAAGCSPWSPERNSLFHTHRCPGKGPGREGGQTAPRRRPQWSPSLYLSWEQVISSLVQLLWCHRLCELWLKPPSGSKLPFPEAPGAPEPTQPRGESRWPQAHWLSRLCPAQVASCTEHLNRWFKLMFPI